MTTSTYLPAGLPAPLPAVDGLDVPYWEGTRRGELLVQRCGSCGTWQWGPEWLCHRCNTFEMQWQPVDGNGLIYSWQRPWHPAHSVLRDFGPYLVVLVELPAAGNIRMVGNLLGPPDQEVVIGAAVEAVFEPHDDAEMPYTLVQWRLSS
ncbi:MAG: OB-fold domain-containing protein [Alphaproteobacteria bacterium]|nr:OB-fold domain-containing protein [Alphaproteobacteria bacterium]